MSDSQIPDLFPAATWKPAEPRPKGPITQWMLDTLEQIETAVQDGDLTLEERLEVIADLDEARQIVGFARDRVSAATVPEMPFRRAVSVQGLGSFAVTKPAKRTYWEDDAAGRAVVARHMETGVIGHPNDVLRALLAAAHVDYWRAGVLEELGLKPDDYRRKEPGTVRIVKV